MRSILSKMILAPVVMAAAAFTAKPAMAEMRVNVPFSFTAEGKNCPAGLYLIKENAASSTVTLISRDAPRMFVWLVGPGNPDPTDKMVRLKFTEDGNTYTLQSVQYQSLITAKLDKHNKHSEHTHTRIIEGQ